MIITDAAAGHRNFVLVLLVIQDKGSTTDIR